LYGYSVTNVCTPLSWDVIQRSVGAEPARLYEGGAGCDVNYTSTFAGIRALGAPLAMRALP